MRALNEVTGEIVDAAYQLHNQVGPGLLESVYEAVLEQKLKSRGLRVERQKRIPLEIDGLRFEEAFRADLIVEGRVLIELKAAERTAPVHVRQTLTYLRLLNLPIGFLINFGVEHMRDGLKRIVNGPSPAIPPRGEPKATPQNPP
jgi:GxxExxY protein